MHRRTFRLLSAVLLLGLSGPNHSSLAAADCSGVAEYVEAMQDAAAGYLEIIDAAADLTVLSPDEIRDLAAGADEVADSYRAIEPPGIAQEYHDTAIQGMQRWANYLRDASTLGIITAAFAYYADDPDGDTLPIRRNEHQSLLAQRCEAFQPYIVWLNTYPDLPTEQSATPIALVRA